MNSFSENGNGFISILNKTSLLEKCTSLQKLIDESSVKTLHQHFTVLVHQIFGIGCTGWGLTWLHPRSAEFNQAKAFLGSSGPMMRMVVKLQADSMLYRYDFPCVMLPPSFLQHFNEHYVLHRPSRTPWSVSNSFNGSTGIGNANASLKGQACMRISAFEFYFYHFAHYILNATTSVPTPPAYGLSANSVSSADEKLYFALLDDYLNHFLPLDGSYLPVMQLPNSTATQVPTQVSPWMNQASSLLKKSPVKQGNSFGVAHNEICLSDMLVRIFVDFWLGQYTVEGVSHQTITIPPEDLVISVRHLVKHIHYFSNANTFSLGSTSGHYDSVMEHFKQNITCNCLQLRLFEFLSHCFDIWPLNPSFRLVLETWLSYIQPWRYTNISISGNSSDTRLSKSRDIANIWYHFISTNLAFYNGLFKAAIKRFLCTDLSHHSNSLLLYRVAKIYSQPNFVSMIEEAEIAFYGMDQSQSASLLHGSFISQKVGGKVSFSLLFSDDMRSHLKQLLIVCKQALGTVKQNALQSSNTDFSSRVLKIFRIDSLSEVGLASNAACWKKSEQQLRDSLQMLSEAFDVPIPDLDDLSDFHGNASNPFGPEAADCFTNENGKIQLSPLGRCQLLNNVKKLPVVVNCDPELQPVRTDENGMLVRLLYRIAKSINTKYAGQLEDLCTRSGIVGKVAKYYLQTPTYGCSNTTALPSPRLTLRFLASYKTLFYIFLFFVLFRLFGGSALGALFYLLVSSFAFCLLQAICCS